MMFVFIKILNCNPRERIRAGGGGLLSNYGGNRIDGFQSSGAVQNVYKEAAKFMIETGSNVAPALAD